MHDNELLPAYFAEIILPLALPMEYTYRVPEEWLEDLEVGRRVIVQFGKKKIYSGLVLRISNQPPENYEAKNILSVLDDHPVVSERQLKFWKWISSYYMCSLGEVMNAALPAAMKLESESKVVLTVAGMEWEKNVDPDRIDPLEIAILKALQTGVDLSVDQVSDIIGKSNPYKYIKSLYEREFIDIEENIKNKYTPKQVRKVRFDPSVIENGKLPVVYEQLEKRAPAQLNVVMILDQSEGKTLETPELARKADTTASTIRALIDKGILEEYYVEVDRIHVDYPDELKINELNEEQKDAITQIHSVFDEEKVCLLHGKTSSGKTHVYIELMEEAIANGGQVLYLLPEISLTTQLIRRIQAYFGEKVMVSHSKFSMNERMEIWQKLDSNEISIVLAPRSGIFMPFHDLKLIIVDEEHENSYKQSEPSPRYNARDAAVVLGKIWDANVLLGSATPSVESYFNAEKNKYGLVRMHNRYSGVSAPQFEIVDLKDSRRKKEMAGLFSFTLRDRMKQVLDDQEQVILFQNRKGYVPVTECNFCGWAPKCVQCDITLTYYKYENKLKCHYCGYTREPVQQCPACGNTSIHMKGYGTERVEDEVKMLFPEAVVQRFDSDTTRKKTAYETIINRFEQKEIDVLVGTQMITKGLDFDHVRLVGIMDADHSLNIPDFRAHERAFQLFTQVGGRAGRRKEQGQVLIQTYQPGHPVLNYARDGDYLSMYQKEITEREKFNYPPYYRLIHIMVKDKSNLIASKASDYLVFLLKPEFGNMLLGPQDPYISKIRGQYLKSIMIKLPSGVSLSKEKAFVRQKIDAIKKEKDYRRTRIIVDVDPY